ncbi:hypothetical protein Asp14428_63900 [Actinoplanes sp. NBRC 14428]|nr:hypothetical protein Asp14428_63900 [Actinoplanes sp. NBRC 14428]
MSQPPYPGPPYPEQPSGQPYQQPGPGYGGPPGYPSAPYQGQPNPDVPASVPPGYPPQPTYGQPEYTQVDYGQAGYTQPGYQQPGAQPGYQQSGYEQPGPPPGYQQPGYPQPGYPQSGPPMTGGYPPPPKPKSRAVPITLVSIAVFLVLCVGGGTAVYLAGRNAADDVVVTDPTTTPTRTAPRGVITVVEPRILGGRPKLTDAQFAGAAEQLKRGLAKVPGASRTVSGLYGTPADQNIVIVAAAAAEVSDPRRELDGIFLGVGVGGLEITGLTTAPPGPLGGYAKCGRGEAGGAPLIMCGWADEGSVGWLLWYYESMSDAKAELATLRGQVEKKSN